MGYIIRMEDLIKVVDKEKLGERMLWEDANISLKGCTQREVPNSKIMHGYHPM